MKVSTWKNMVIALLVLLNLAALSTIWLGHRSYVDHPQVEKRYRVPHDRPEAGPRDVPHRQPVDFVMIDALNLNEQQTTDFRKLKESHHERSAVLHNQIRELKEEVFSAISENDREAAERLSKEIGGLQQEMEILLFDHFSDIRAICDDKQQDRFDDMLSRIGERIHPGPHQGRRPLH